MPRRIAEILEERRRGKIAEALLEQAKRKAAETGKETDRDQYEKLRRQFGC